MKKTTYFLFTLLFMAAMFITSHAKAQDTPCQDGDPISGTCPIPPSGGGALPINSGVVYLLAAGAFLGVAAVRKQKAALDKA